MFDSGNFPAVNSIIGWQSNPIGGGLSAPVENIKTSFSVVGESFSAGKKSRCKLMFKANRYNQTSTVQSHAIQQTTTI